MSKRVHSPEPSGADLWPIDASAPVAWAAVASGRARLDLRGAGRPGLEPLTLDFDFGPGTGFVVARAEAAFEVPEDWEMRLRVRGDAPANTIEVKVADPAGTSVWRWKRECFAPPAEWTPLRLPGHAFEFAWGPKGGGAPGAVGAVEIAIVAPPGGRGRLEIADLRVVDRGAARFRELRASSCAPGTSAAMAVDGDACSCWCAADDDDESVLTLEFEDARDLGGIVVRWAEGSVPSAFRVETKDAGGKWSERYRADTAGAAVSFVPMAVLDPSALRLVASGWVASGRVASGRVASGRVVSGRVASGGVAVTDLALKPYGWSRTPSDFLTAVATASVRGEYPRYLLREQSLWTPVASPTSGPLALLGEDGAVEVGEGGFSLEPSLMVEGEATPRWVTWADVRRSVLLEEAPLPVPTVRWHAGALELDVTAVAEDAHAVVRYRVRNTGRTAVAATLFVAVRPFQVTPPWQAWRGLGGPAELDSISCGPSSIAIAAGGRTAALASWPPASGAGATSFDAGGLAPWLSRGEVPPFSAVTDPHAQAEGVLRFALDLAPLSFADVFVACTPLRTEAAPAAVAEAAADGAARIAAAIEAWRRALPLHLSTGGGSEAFAVATTAIAHVLACRDGAALQPGPRRYTRSWIRDGAIMAASLARAGRSDAASAFVEWYAPFQRDDGFVPCCVDRDGADPLVEHDSHGQLIHAVAETYRFTRDKAFASALWPRCSLAAEFLEALRATRLTPEFAEGARRTCYGLLPESVSHEGYLAQPVHAYWDDLWALRGLRDAAFLARELGRGGEALRWKSAADGLAAAMAASIRLVMQERALDTVPASVEWADFDPTAIAGAVSLTGGFEVFPPEALAKTFDLYMVGSRARRDPAHLWNNYSPYEARIIGALVRLGRRDEANEVLDALLADRRPLAWNQWPEILWRDAAAPAHVGDLPHCWIGAEYAFALRMMLVFEREDDGALVVGAGLRREWLDAGVEAKGLPTWWGLLDVSIRRDGEVYRVTVGGGAKPPGGVVLALPEGCAAVIDAG